jgi:hypothetical protein
MSAIKNFKANRRCKPIKKDILYTLFEYSSHVVFQCLLLPLLRVAQTISTDSNLQFFVSAESFLISNAFPTISYMNLRNRVRMHVIMDEDLWKCRNFEVSV